MTTHQAVADYFLSQAEWREHQAQEYPEDRRNARSARGLRDLAEYVLVLPDDDAILAALVQANSDAGAPVDVFMPGEDTSRLASRFRFDDPLEAMDRFLAKFAAEREREAVEASLPAYPEEAARDLDSTDPAVQLRAVRYLSDHLDAWEADAVDAARSAGWTWDRIAAYLGRSRQAAWKRHRTIAERVQVAIKDADAMAEYVLASQPEQKHVRVVEPGR